MIEHDPRVMRAIIDPAGTEHLFQTSRSAEPHLLSPGIATSQKAVDQIRAENAHDPRVMRKSMPLVWKLERVKIPCDPEERQECVHTLADGSIRGTSGREG